jgi:hypothetical protein
MKAPREVQRCRPPSSRARARLHQERHQLNSAPRHMPSGPHKSEPSQRKGAEHGRDGDARALRADARADSDSLALLALAPSCETGCRAQPRADARVQSSMAVSASLSSASARSACCATEVEQRRGQGKEAERRRLLPAAASGRQTGVRPPRVPPAAVNGSPMAAREQSQHTTLPWPLHRDEGAWHQRARGEARRGQAQGMEESG